MYPLTGSPHKFYIHDEIQKQDGLWQKILTADEKTYPMCTAVASEVDADVGRSSVKRVGLVDAHAYSLIGAKLITLDNGKTEKLIQIRNPWGKKEW